ncbi:MAG: LysR substrate-binding domain-containing protein, partial [Methylococcales bacterium]
MNSLIAAEVAARLASFKSASEKLHVTPSAVSHQIRILEDWLGFSLFNRSTRSVTLTEAGDRYLKHVSELLDGLEAATREEVERTGKRQILRVQTTDSLASRWLIGRLPDFLHQHPGIFVQIVTFEFTEGFRPSEVDVAVLYGRGDWPNCKSEMILKETIFPVCSPQFFSPQGADNKMEVFSHPLIHDVNLGTSWQEWWRYAEDEVGKDRRVDLTAGLRLNHSHLALQAAELGNGIALASRPLVLDSLQRRTLAAPFDSQLSTGFGYYVIQSLESEAQNRCRPFVEWLHLQGDC